MLAKDSFRKTLIFSASALSESSVDGNALADLGNGFGRDEFQIVYSHDFDNAVVLGERVVEGDFVLVQSQIDAALSDAVIVQPVGLALRSLLPRDRTIISDVQRLLEHAGELVTKLPMQTTQCQLPQLSLWPLGW